MAHEHDRLELNGSGLRRSDPHHDVDDYSCYRYLGFRSSVATIVRSMSCSAMNQPPVDSLRGMHMFLRKVLFVRALRGIWEPCSEML